MATIYPLNRMVTLDIETVASPDAEGLLDPVRAPAHYKDPSKILAYQTEKLAERVANASLEADLCEVVAIGCDQGQGADVMTRAELDEPQLLEWCWDRTVNSRLVGFNILNFDLPVLMRRSQLLGVPCPQINLDRYRTPHIDLLQRLSFNGAITFRSLNFYCRRFQLDCDMDDPVVGSEIPQLVKDGEWALIHAHCLFDVKKTRALAERLGLLVPEQVAS